MEKRTILSRSVAVLILVVGLVGGTYFFSNEDKIATQGQSGTLHIVLTIGWTLLALKLCADAVIHLVNQRRKKDSGEEARGGLTRIGISLAALAYAWFVMDLPGCIQTLISKL